MWGAARPWFKAIPHNDAESEESSRDLGSRVHAAQEAHPYAGPWDLWHLTISLSSGAFPALPYERKIFVRKMDNKVCPVNQSGESW